MPIKARPPVHRSMSAGAASQTLDVGLDKGKITGRLAFSAMARTMSSVKAPGCMEVPTRAVDFGVADGVEKRDGASARCRRG